MFATCFFAVANAMVFSGIRGMQPVELPMDSSLFKAELERQIRASKKDLEAIVPVPHPLVADLLVPAEATRSSE